MAMAVSAPVVLEVDAPEQVTNWRPLVQWILAIPHLFIANVLRSVSGVLGIVSLFAILFTEKIPDGIVNFQIMTLRYQTRVHVYAGFMHEQYPPFDFTPSAADPGGTPVRVSVQPQADLNRWLPLVKWFLAIPHYVMILIYGIAAIVLWIVNFFIVLFTGKWNPQHRTFIVKFLRYVLKVEVYILLLRDDYPSFTLV
jgi:hypothetical protein